MFADFDSSARAKILRFRRKQQFDAEFEKQRRAKQLAEMLADERIAAWIQRWEQIKADRVAALRKHLEWCRLSPETKEERAVSKKLNREVKARTKLVFKRAGQAGHDLELPECEALALEEVLLKRRRGRAGPHFRHDLRR